MRICYHGTNKENAQSILKEGFRPGTYFTWHLEDAIEKGGNYVFEVAFDDPPNHWQFAFTDKSVEPDRIVSHTVYQRERKVNNEELRKEVFDSPKIPPNRAAKWRNFNHGEWAKLDEQFDHAAWDECIKAERERRRCTAPTVEGWMEQMEEGLKKAMAVCGGRPPFHPNAYYNDTGDILEVFLSDEMSYAKWLNPQVTVLLAQETDEVVGFQIWGMSHVKDIKEIQKKWELQKKE